MNVSPNELARRVFVPTVFSRQDLLNRGFTGRSITTSLKSGLLIRLRRDRYVRAGAPDDIAVAARIGGRITCLTLLRMLGIFVLAATGVHLQVSHNSSRFAHGRAAGSRVHWANTAGHEFLHVTSIAEAILHAMRCQEPRAALGTLDSLLHHRLVSEEQLTSIFRGLPPRFHALLRLVDPSAESGPETFVRLMLRALGVSYETQVWLKGVGRVDFIVDGWLIIECDSREFHEGWKKQQEDRRRDIAAARLGFVTIRPLAADILYDSSSVQQTLSRIIEVLGPRFTRAARS